MGRKAVVILSIGGALLVLAVLVYGFLAIRNSVSAGWTDRRVHQLEPTKDGKWQSRGEDVLIEVDITADPVTAFYEQFPPFASASREMQTKIMDRVFLFHQLLNARAKARPFQKLVIRRMGADRAAPSYAEMNAQGVKFTDP